MTDERLTDELLSAYFDGEVSAEERAAIERAREGSKQTEQTLEGFAYVRSLLKELPSPSTPSDFAAAVQAAVSIPPRLAAGRRARRWWLSRPVMGAALSAAALVALVIWWPGGSSQPPGESVVMGPSSGAPAPMADDMATSSEQAPTDAVAIAASRPLQMAESGASTADSSLPSSLAALRKEILSEPPEPGDLLKYLDEEADQVTLVTVRVLDVAVAPGQIRLLLSRNGIQATTALDASSARNVPNEPDANGQFAIFAVTDPTSLANVVSELDMQEFVVRCEIDQPAPVSGAFAQASQEGPPESAIDDRRETEQPVREPESTPAPAAESMPPAVVASRDADTDAAATPDVPSVQVTVNIPDELLRRKFASRLSPSARTVGQQQDKSAQEFVRQQRAPTARSAVAGAPMQVLILIEPNRANP